MSANCPKISVILPAYNAEKYISEAIESVLNQTWPNLELIVVDDGSTDGTAGIVRSFGDQVRYLYQSNARQAAARNNGIKHSAGEYLAFIDADDTWMPEKLERQMGLHQSMPGLGMIYCSINEIDRQGRHMRTVPALLRGSVMQEILLGRGGFAGGSTMLVPRSVIEEVGLFDEMLPPVEDTDIIWRIAAIRPIDFIEDPLASYRIHSGGSHMQIDRMAMAWKRMYRKVDSNDRVRREGWVFRLRCRHRLNYMLAGDYAKAGKVFRSLAYGIKAAFWWPPGVLRMFRKAI
ncbi:MAG: glycosyltransferase family 2 protein [Acidobacteriota bacterium]|nr:MAG: glycosyltransferase family 2 protein [Acidobacteriota bacterium]